MTPLEALRALPHLVARRAELRAALSDAEAELGRLGSALSAGGADGQLLVCLAIQAAGEPDQAPFRFDGADLAPAVLTVPGRADQVLVEIVTRRSSDGAVDREVRVDGEPVVPTADVTAYVAGLELPEPPAARADQSEPIVAEPVRDRADPAPEPGERADQLGAATAEPAPVPDEGWVSFKRYGELCGVTEQAIYHAVSRGLIDGEAVRPGPPKRIRPELADRQVLERATAGTLREGVERRTAPPAAEPADDPDAAEPDEAQVRDAIAYLKADWGYTICRLQGGAFDVNTVRMTAARLVEKARHLRGIAARRAEAGAGVAA